MRSRLFILNQQMPPFRGISIECNKNREGKWLAAMTGSYFWSRPACGGKSLQNSGTIGGRFPVIREITAIPILDMMNKLRDGK